MNVRFLGNLLFVLKALFILVSVQAFATCGYVLFIYFNLKWKEQIDSKIYVWLKVNPYHSL